MAVSLSDSIMEEELGLDYYYYSMQVRLVPRLRSSSLVMQGKLRVEIIAVVVD